MKFATGFASYLNLTASLLDLFPEPPQISRMKAKFIPVLVAVGSLVAIGCAPDPAPHTTTSESTTVVMAPNGTEETLLSALNGERRKAGMTELVMSSHLAEMARTYSDAGASAGAFPVGTTETLPASSGFASVVKLRGTLKDRGPQTGSGFVEYWAKDQRSTVMGNWTQVGVAVSKSADGRLFAAVLLAH